MMYMETKEGKVTSYIAADPYLPLSLYFEKERDNCRHMGFYAGESTLLEIGTDYLTKEIAKLTLVTSADHAMIDETLVLPTCDEARLYYEMPRHVDCEQIVTRVYKDGVEFLLANNEPVEFIRCGQVYFGFDEEKRIVKVIVAEMKPDEIEHTRSLLEELDSEADTVYVFADGEWAEKPTQE